MESSVIQNIIEAIQSYLPMVLQITGSFALIATMTPNKVDDKILQVIMDIVNFLGGNLGKAKNTE
jgi:hypothetical protein